MPRPRDPALAFHWDRQRLKHETDEECDEYFILLGIKKNKATYEDQERRKAALPPDRRYVSELDKREKRRTRQ
jgi:hypothetical protein